MLDISQNIKFEDSPDNQTEESHTPNTSYWLRDGLGDSFPIKFKHNEELCDDDSCNQP